MLKERKKPKAPKNIPLFLTGLLYIFLLTVVIFFMNYIQQLLDKDAKINFTEVVNQNENIIAGRLRLEVNNLETISSQIIDRYKISEDESLEDVFIKYYIDNPEEKRLFAGQLNGDALFTNGEALNISGREYFKLASSEVKNISGRVISRQTKEDIFVISVPLNDKGEVIGTLQKWYTPEEMYHLCSVSSFSSQSKISIIDNDGYILISSENSGDNSELENYYHAVEDQENTQLIKKLKKDLENEKSGFIEITIAGKKTFLAYTPIDQLHGWYLISSVDMMAASLNGNRVVKLFYCVLILMILLFVVSIMAFLSYKNRQQNNLKRIVFIDDVTGGNTYSKFVVELKEVIHQYPLKHFYLLKLDIDNFKYVNNYYGFDFGDKILYKINHEISQILNDNELIARIYSDHFVLLLEDADCEKIDKIITCMEKEEDVEIRCSGGLYALQDYTESVNLMVDKASLAATKSKGNIHNKVSIYTNEFDKQMIKNEQMKQALKLAIANKQLVPFYQPKVDVNTRELIGAEALVRWRNDLGKLVPPDEFIPLCEKTGLITDLDMLIFDQVLIFLRKNLDANIKCVPISINFSRLHLLDNEFMHKLLTKMEYYSIPTNLIEIELTENIMFDNFQRVVDFISTLHENGFVVSMDDFGSGYSSLNMLKDIPVDTLKIDRLFLEDTTDRKRQIIIFSAIAKMAEQLNIKVVVEGVETIENVTLMKEVGCYVAQGYYFAKPMEETRFQIILKAKKVD